MVDYLYDKFMFKETFHS